MEDAPIAVPEADLDDLRDRLRRTRWPEAETVEDWSQGIPLAYVQDLCSYWADSYDWRVVEARLNALGPFRTGIDGLGIHGLHARSPHPGALPLVLTHGWPGSVVEFLDAIGPLVDPPGARGRRGRRLPRRVPGASGLRVQRQAHGHGLGDAAHRRGVGRAHAAPRL